ncbi:DUF1572 family protein [Paenibacillus physcomitrellae]|uniref:DUF1572 domain-containing protein n=1 Tax=Paenibacillus physcomitrellae TaxID=1619311 RepID=A0ABQ1GJT7_9BACL|nr:DUF1572 family protein [Paenibacillus physcomitrellae]GGA45276.1 hypothetical protein GCM10010917_33210 [Paenibacillus physcomitrellae]
MFDLQSLLLTRFQDIHKRMLLALDQLDDEQVNWRPNASSNSIANLIIHISGNIKERIGDGMNHIPFTRDRDAEFEELSRTKSELVAIINEIFTELDGTLNTMDEERFKLTQEVRGQQRSHLETFIQTATHLAEHLGQILYIAKMLKDEQYISTSTPKKIKS